ncbi:flavin reductase family protein [Gordonia sp. C13]|uniref:flavin reductase family protein n=1 Tax=Gordonia sp. C13 TaxID=2935078 RepID=UPI00200B8BD1|nr:flavin reductase family protein [Gordonia sp. C13]MCK8613704.1 flavin reductase family protein [Gordonia sp. C13]
MTDNVISAIDPSIFRNVMGHYPTGVVVVTGREDDGSVLAMVVGTFSSVSMDPPLVSFMPMKTSRTFEKMRSCESLCINILGGEQEDVVLTVAQRWENKLEGIEWFSSPSGDPVLTDSVAWIDTRIRNVVEAGDHWITLCEVRDLAVTNPVAPLIFFQGGYGSFVSTSLMARMDHEILPTIHAAHAARPQVEALAASVGCEVSVLTAVSRDEMAVVLSATAPGVDREEGLAYRIPMVPPIGDTYVFDQDDEIRERWLAKLRNADDDVRQLHRDRLEFVRQHGYLVSFLPEEGSTAYEEMRAATKSYERGRLTPSQEREICESIGKSPVDYRIRDVRSDQTYDVGSLVLPIRDARGGYSMTLRLSQLPPGVGGAQLEAWIAQARAVVEVLGR